ncbi:Scr1 family TA system antitoxin-like transcriptional regulator [Kitasatospora sp. NPDC096147]|uniref:Scr1 family TA system antitoxin-like transcriptional regulator n=1 Tax=Kitasatospora sp. NPDC096147 TaxID=3364093 RepID=UPI00381371D4
MATSTDRRPRDRVRWRSARALRPPRSRSTSDTKIQGACLQRRAGDDADGCDDEALAGQLNHLLNVAALPHVSVGIVPFRARRTVWPSKRSTPLTRALWQSRR